jgi:hypothetical protein
VRRDGSAPFGQCPPLTTAVTLGEQDMSFGPSALHSRRAVPSAEDWADQAGAQSARVEARQPCRVRQFAPAADGRPRTRNGHLLILRPGHRPLTPASPAGSRRIRSTVSTGLAFVPGIETRGHRLGARFELRPPASHVSPSEECGIALLTTGRNGPGRDRTCDLGIKSPANVSNVSALAATACA